MNDRSAITVRFNYADSDWLHIVRFYRSSSRRNKVGRAISVLLLAVATYYLLITGFFPLFGRTGDRLLVTGLFVLIVIDAVESWFQPIHSFRTWLWLKRTKLDVRNYEFTFDEAGAHYRLSSESSQADVRLAWTEFDQLLESSRAFLLVLRDDGFWAIPKRAYQDDDTVKGTREILTRKVAKTE